MSKELIIDIDGDGCFGFEVVGLDKSIESINIEKDKVRIKGY